MEGGKVDRSQNVGCARDSGGGASKYSSREDYDYGYGYGYYYDYYYNYLLFTDHQWFITHGPHPHKSTAQQPPPTLAGTVLWSSS